MNVSDFIAVIEKTAPLAAAAPWDASGIQVAAFRQEIGHVAVMLDPRLEAMTQAVKSGADFILCHHPLSMKPVFPNQGGAYLKILSLLLRHDVWLYSAHTSFDASPHGTAGWLGRELGLAGVRVLEPVLPLSGCGDVPFGFGCVGDLASALSYGAFCQKLAGAIGKSEWTGSGPVPAKVGRVAFCPGSGSSMLAAAVKSGADVFVTGDVKYHTALEAEDLGLRLLDVGHFSLEEEMFRRFSEALADGLPLKVSFFPSVDPISTERVNLV